MGSDPPKAPGCKAKGQQADPKACSGSASDHGLESESTCGCGVTSAGDVGVM